jgi:outer membrane protein OmpA-like peptidoglycan-associated protein
MESQRKTRTIAAVILSALLTACTSAPKEAATQGAKPVHLGIRQVGVDKTARYVYCEESACPGPTRKTLPDPIRPIAAVAMPPAPIVSHQPVDIAFPFNSSRINKSDKDKLIKAVAASKGTDVEIIARSDFVGPPAGQKKVAGARAKAMRSIVAKQAHGVRIVEHQEIAGPDRVAANEQSQQRRGTVRFIQPTNVSMKGLNQ